MTIVELLLSRVEHDKRAWQSMRAVPWQVSTAQHERLAVVVFGIASDMPAK